MSYVVLARKWRPQSFEDLVGQEHVSTTLGNAIAQNRVAHAFLFTGVRGVGKTTSARILAKALNCAKGPTATPCQVCPQCVEITAGKDLDVQEIDGASYNSVDDVRRLQSTLAPQPARDRFKIFIVDEVHMLSGSAWNAFLKTLEEPPPHVKFIFATTEVHKVPVTILSRCQRYDFKLITAQRIASRLRWVLEQENVAAEDAAVTAIAREAAGSMRDAMSLLDQVIAWVGTEGDRLTGEGVAKVLGVADRVVLHQLAAAVLDGDAAACVRIVGELAQQGYDLPHVARDFLAQLRDLVIAKVSDDPGPLLDLADAEVADVKALAARAEADDLTRLHQGLSRSFDDIVKSGQPRASLEMALVRLARRPPLLPIDELLRRLGDLERRLGGSAGGPPPGAAGRGAPQGPPPGGAPQGPPRRMMGASAGFEAAAPAPADFAPPRAAAAAPQVAPAPPQTVQQPQPAQTVQQQQPPQTVQQPQPAQTVQQPQQSARQPEQPQQPPPSTQQPSQSAPQPQLSPIAQPSSQSTPQSAQAPQASPPQQVAPSPPVAPSRPPSFGPPPSSFGPPPSFNPPRSPPPPSFTPPRAAAASAPPAPVRSGMSPITPAEIEGWRRVVQLVREKRPALASVLEHAALLKLGAERVELGYETNSFLSGQATEASAKELLASALQAHFGRVPEISFETIASKNGAVTIALMDGAERKLKLDAARRAVVEHPLVTAAIELLGAELKDVRLAAEAEG